MTTGVLRPSEASPVHKPSQGSANKSIKDRLPQLPQLTDKTNKALIAAELHLFTDGKKGKPMTLAQRVRFEQELEVCCQAIRQAHNEACGIKEAAGKVA